MPKINSFAPFSVSVLPGKYSGKIRIEFPPVHLKLLDLSMDGLLPGAHVGADTPAFDLVIDVGDSVLSAGQLVDMLMGLEDNLEAVYRVTQEHFDVTFILK